MFGETMFGEFDRMKSGRKRRLADTTRFEAMHELRQYWSALAASGRIPLRDEIDPREIAPWLESSFVLERIAPGVGRFRLAGRKLNDLASTDLRGAPASVLFEPSDRRDLSAAIEQCCTRPAISELWLQSQGGIGRPRLEAALILLPLCDSQGHVSRMLGALDYIGSPGRAPRRFGILRKRRTALEAASSHPAMEAAPRQGTALHQLYAPAPFSPEPTPRPTPGEKAGTGARRATLRLVVDNTRPERA